MWSPQGPPVMLPTPGQPTQRYGLGAVTYHTGETVVLFRRPKRRPAIAAFLQTLLERPPGPPVSVAWDHVNTPAAEAVAAVVRGAAGRWVLLSFPTYRPWLNPLEMLWRYFRQEVTPGELVEPIKALVTAAQEVFTRSNQQPERVRSIIGAIPKNLAVCT